MIEMFEVNLVNTTTTSSITDFNEIFTQNTTHQNVTNSILTDVITNTTAFAVDYAAQWLSSTVSSVGNETTSTSHLTAPIDSILNHSYYNPTSSYNIVRTDLIAENTNIANNDDDYDRCDPNSTNFNCSRSDFLLYALGPQTLPLYKVLMITILYGGIFITGFFGNVLVCVVIVKHSAMHTATNYYLFSLAASDLIYLIFGLPTEVYLYWHQYPYLFGLPFCKARAYISEASTYVSVLTIVAFSVERYLAICHPLHLYAMSGFKRAIRIIAMLWLVSFIAAIPFGLWSQISFMFYPPDKSLMAESAFCVCNTPEHMPLFEVSFVVFFLVPMLLIFYFYGRMGVKIRSRTSQKLGVQKGSLHRESRHQQSRKAVIRMLAAVVLTFFICWLPFHIQRLWFVYGNTSLYFQEINEWLFSITGFAYYVSCTINPILYNVMSHRYRVAFKDILCGKRRNIYYNNGFARDQSSFRETVATSVCNSSDRAHSVRVRSVTIVDNVNHRISIKSNNVNWKKTDFKTPLDKDIPENHSTKLAGTNAVVVCVDSDANGRTKVFTENETLLNQNNETCI